MEKLKRYNFDKNARLDLVCAKELDCRIMMQCIFFEGGKAVASDGHAIIVASLEEISDLQPDSVEKLNGKYLHSQAFRKILDYKYIDKIDDEGIIVSNGNNCFSVKFLFAKLECGYPDYKKVIANIKDEKSIDKKVRIDPRQLIALCKCVNGYQPIIERTSNTSPMTIRWKGLETVAYLTTFCLPDW